MTRQEFMVKYVNHYCWLMRNNKSLLDNYIPKARTWNKESCKEEALKYKTATDWQKNSSGSYSKAAKAGWLDYCSEHMPKLNKKHKLKDCKKEALKYNTRREFELCNRGMYFSVIKNKWNAVCFKHMSRSKTARRKVINIDTNEIFDTVSAAKKKYTGTVASVLAGKSKTAGGYRWAYCDEEGNLI